MRIIIAEDGVLLREGLVNLLQQAGHEVVAAVADAESLVQFTLTTGREGLDLVVTDVRMPPGLGNDGLRAALRIKEARPELGVMVLSQYIADAYIQDLVKGWPGGVGYLLKDRIGRVAHFMNALETVASGGTVVDPEVIQQLLKRSGFDRLSALTPREREVLDLMAQGKSNGEISSALFVSDAAVSKHIGNIFSKLGLVEAEGNKRVRSVLTYLGIGRGDYTPFS